MKKRIVVLFIWLLCVMYAFATTFPQVKDKALAGYFPLVGSDGAATICTDSKDYAVVGIAAQMLADDVQRVTGVKMTVTKAKAMAVPSGACVVAGTLGKSRLTDSTVRIAA